ncbi:phosphatase PAP2 family protein [Bradyrhizobium sp. ISRA443]|uniref:phosphatase PAP2 family protein n=1 Tax=unclassified Bradyrhizobium TaxID=2631580 RepID=UPI00247A28E9|nr:MULTISPECIES: phosphatase PAP2 family protein [unclassified Bradyrhizobium]WGS00179.1 phosphatase PAP2 family protein [Bradyrhizobium sp. ISRA436]WGS07068.1 phosphatase PAP2 family protein [Bradyrhizobium sp. ISRA437]WGS13951.1 phosphatase PAP2 family protein [Bradyrhizobium sp. ISRA443]
MNPDEYLLRLLNQFAHRSAIFDTAVGFVAGQAVFKGALVTSLLWLAWFQRDPDQKRRRSLVISTLAATIASLLITKIIRSYLPFRLRPIHDPAVGFTLPYHVSTETLWNWSSFPSDTAAFEFALAVGVFMIWRRWGWLAILYSLVVISLPRVYLGYHYPSDIVVGALIGAAVTLIMGREKIRIPLSQRLLLWSNEYPGAFYCAFFLFTYEVAAVFENTRQILTAAWKLSHHSVW